MADPSQARKIGGGLQEKGSPSRPLGLKIYVGVYTLGWIAVFIAMIFVGTDTLIYVPIPIIGFYLTYKLWKLQRWAWAILLFAHGIAILASFVEFISDEIGTTVLLPRIVLGIILATYLYLIKDYFH